MYAVIDIGSNSVRLMLFDGVKAVKKICKITKLAEGLGIGSALKKEASERTAETVSTLCKTAKDMGCKKVYAFATAAVREAVNGKEFCDRVNELCGVKVDVIKGEEEAELGFSGAVDGDGGIIDIGGASTEVTVKDGGEVVFKKSVGLGVVKIRDFAEYGFIDADQMIETRIKEFGKIPVQKFFGIGGTATSVAAIMQRLSPYDPEKVDGFVIKIEDLKEFYDKIYSLSVSELKNLKGLQEGRADVIKGGINLLYKLMLYIGIDKITVSEKDNLEGYFYKNRDKIEKGL